MVAPLKHQWWNTTNLPLSHCLYCGSSLSNRNCPVCEPEQFQHIIPSHRIDESDKGKPSKPGPK